MKSTALSLIKLNEKTLADKDSAKVELTQIFADLSAGQKTGNSFNLDKTGNEMQKRLRGSKRAILKKVTAVNLFADQATQIQAIMEATSAQEVAPIVRLLLDEALGARRRKSVHSEEPEQVPPIQNATDLETIQTLVLKLICQGEITFRMQSVCLELLQEAMVEVRAGKTSLWEFLAAPALKEKGISALDVVRLFDGQTTNAKNFAYGLAEEIKKEIDTDLDSISLPTDDEDRQASFAYEAPDTQENLQSRDSIGVG